MFNFFSKKLFLRDLFEGFVDIHNHILPGIDDGAQNVMESVDLIKAFKTLGVSQFIPTPHIMQGFYPNTDETIGNSYQMLLEALVDASLLTEIKINPAAEYMLDDNFERLLKNRDLFTLNKNYVLVEMSYFQPPINLENIIFDIKTHGYIPVLAHPERYSFYHKSLDYYERLKQLGCLFQLNLLSLSEHYGKHVEKTAKHLINNQMIDFVGSDVHKIQHITKLSKLRVDNIKIYNQLKDVFKNTNNAFSVTS